jgi:flagellar basal body-associated protein FliL
MKKIIVIVLLVVVLAIGTLGGLAILGMGPLANLIKPLNSTEKTAEAPVQPEAAKPKTLDLGTYIIPLVSRRDISRQIGMDLVIVVSADAAPRVSAEMPRLQNALLVDLYDFVPQHADSRSAQDREAIHQRLVKIAAKIVGEDAVRDVVIKSIYDR